VEVEMKMKITVEQAENLVDGKLRDWHISRGGGWCALHKSDTYYSFGGIAPKTPKNIIRVRDEGTIENPDFKKIITGKLTEKTISNWHAYLTIKEKNTSPSGIESNKEYEGEITPAKLPFEMAMSIANFKPYFFKVKDSISFYVEYNEGGNIPELHCEIVNVNGIGPFLEVEVTSDNFSKDDIVFWINRFFEENIGCIDFDKRSWPQIIEEGK
jgi:adenylate cyclase class IV